MVMLPASPMKIFAGGQLWHRNPIRPPAITVVSIASGR